MLGIGPFAIERLQSELGWGNEQFSEILSFLIREQVISVSNGELSLTGEYCARQVLAEQKLKEIQERLKNIKDMGEEKNESSREYRQIETSSSGT